MVASHPQDPLTVRSRLQRDLRPTAASRKEWCEECTLGGGGGSIMPCVCPPLGGLSRDKAWLDPLEGAPAERELEAGECGSREQNRKGKGRHQTVPAGSACPARAILRVSSTRVYSQFTELWVLLS